MRFLEDVDDEKLKETAVFMVKVVLAGLFFRALIYVSPDTYVLESAIASVSAESLRVLGTSLELFGNRIIIDPNMFVVNQDCLGWKSIAAFTGLCWASDINNLKKTVFIGAIALVILNIVRIVTTILLSVNGIISFEVLHIFLWRWGLTAAVFGFWIISMKKDFSFNPTL